MLSTKVLSNAGSAQHYFLGEDNYYTKEKGMKEDRAQWWGRGAELLGLKGKVEGLLFTQLLNGKLLNGQELGVVVDGKLKHRAGFDLTFSAPKSVSILALIGGDTRIFSAVERATDKALSLIEKSHAKARITKGGITEPIKTENLVVAKFLHDISREGDPQLHTHCVVMNMTQRPDGMWRSLASQIGNYQENAQKMPQGFIEEVRHSKKYYGTVFRAELAYELAQLGYTIEKKGMQGFFEISGISEKTLQAYSKRREEIETYLKTHGFSGAKSAAIATLETRQNKRHLDPAELQALWQEKSNDLRLDTFHEARTVVEAALSPQKSTFYASEDFSSAQKVVQDAMAVLSETSVTLSENAILYSAMQNAIGKDLSVDIILKALDSEKTAQNLIPIFNNSQNGEMKFATKASIEAETILLDTVSKLHRTESPMLPTSQLHSEIQKYSTLTENQRTALQTLFSSKNCLMALTGAAGSGKTHLIKPILELGEKSGYKPILLEFNQSAILNLQQSMRSYPRSLREWVKQLFDQKQFATITSFLKHPESFHQNTFFSLKPLLLVDRAQQLSAFQLQSLIKYVSSHNGRLMLVGDPKAPLTWQAGSPFTQLLSHGVIQAELRGNYRTQDLSLQSAVSKSIQNKIPSAFLKIGHKILEIEDSVQRIESMAAHYVGMGSAQRRNADILMPNKKSCEEMNLAIRERLKAMGELSQTEKTLSTLQPRFFNPIEARYAKNYRKGQWVRFYGEYKSLHVRRGEYREIHGIDPKKNLVFLKDAKEKMVWWNPEKIAMGKTAIFDQKMRNISVGENIFWKCTDKKLRFVAGEALTVIAWQGNTMVVQGTGKKKIILDTRHLESRHFDYGYSRTLHQKSTKTPDCIIAYQNAASKQSHQRNFYGLISQARHQAWIYTENREQLLNTIQRHGGDKTTAVEALIAKTAEDNRVLNNKIIEAAVEKALQDLQKIDTKESIIQNAVQYAIAHLSEREAAFRQSEVMQHALQYALGTSNLEGIQLAVKNAEQRGELISGLCSKNGQIWTTIEAIQLEKEIVNLARQDANTLEPLASKTAIQVHFKNPENKLSAEHRKVLKEILSQKNRTVLLQGFAGTGKTTLLQQVQSVLLLERKHLLCLAPTHQAVKELKNRGLFGQTVDQFLKDAESAKLSLNEKNIIAVDESSMVSNRKLYGFLKCIHDQKARSILIGDTRQYAAIDAGKPFALLQRAGIQTLHLTKITRQKNLILEKAVQETYASDFKKAMQTLEKNIIEIGGKMSKEIETKPSKDRHLTICEHYLSHSKSERANTLVLTFSNAERVQLNAKIRAGLQLEGTLKGEGIVASILASKSMTLAQKSLATNYQIGDVIRFNHSDYQLGIEKNQYWKVEGIQGKENLLELSQENQKMLCKPGNISSEVYRRDIREVQTGDFLRWTRTDKSLGLINPEVVEVLHVEKNIFTVKPITENALNAQKTTFQIHTHDPKFQHWDYAYVMTGYSAQGKSVSSVIINAESNHPRLTHQIAFLVGITRAVDQLTIYTENKAALLSAIEANSGEKTSALEVVEGLKARYAHLPKSQNIPTQASLNSKEKAFDFD